MPKKIEINAAHLIQQILNLAKIGALEGGGVCRLALTDEEGKGRDWVVSWMKDLNLDVSIDEIGNVLGRREGLEDLAPVVIGSHIDTVATAGPYDGCLGVLAGLEVIETLNRHNIETKRPIVVGFFTNEEGARFAPDMMGSMVRQGQTPLADVINTAAIDGPTVAEELERIGYKGDTPCEPIHAHAFFELHIEQGPVLEVEGVEIGAVTGVQGISWTELHIAGVSNHAGTTPMSLRNDAGYAAAAIAVFLRKMTQEMAPNQLATVGRVVCKPNLINVVPNDVLMTLDIRNPDESQLQLAESKISAFLRALEKEEGVTIKTRKLARFEPVVFNPEIVSLIENEAKKLGASVKRMPSGAGHDAQSFAPTCPSGMIFVPSVGGISHNIKEFTKDEDVVRGANVLLNVVLIKAND